jgi:hypothetical protein
MDRMRATGRRCMRSTEATSCVEGPKMTDRADEAGHSMRVPHATATLAPCHARSPGVFINVIHMAPSAATVAAMVRASKVAPRLVTQSAGS